MIRVKRTDWRVQICDDEGRWFDYANPPWFSKAIRIYDGITGPNKRLLRNGEPLRISHETNDQPSLWEAG